MRYFAAVMEQWHWWTLIVLVLLIGEAFVPGLVLGSLAVGAAAGGVASMITESWEYQFVWASVGSLLSLVFLRPLAMRKWFSGDSVATGVDALPGREVRVTDAFDVKTGRGRGRIDGDDWLIEFPEDWSGRRDEGQTALNSPGQYAVGDRLEILRVESNVLIVIPIN
jgi:membrane protein implicated in regulation of membrane protease activity